MRVSLCLFFLAIANFTLLWFIGVSLGGSALNGRVENGRYYLGNHGDLTEVSETTWNYCYYHEVSVLVTHPLGIGSMALAHHLEQRDTSAHSKRPEVREFPDDGRKTCRPNQGDEIG